MSKTVTCLWFKENGEEAAAFYVSLFPNSKVTSSGGIITEFELDGVPYQILNGGPVPFDFTEAISISISTDGQEETDHYWDNLVEGGEPSVCGWLKDRYGLSWQIVPKQLLEYLGDPDPERAAKAQQCMMGQSKIVLAEFEAAVNG